MLPEYKPGPYDLDGLDAAAAGELWNELGAWVEWLRETYQVGSDIHACWYRHPGLVRELLAAFAEWRSAYSEEGDGGAPAIWHNRTLWPLVGRAGRLHGSTRCATGECGFTARAPQKDPDGFAAFVRADLSARAASGHDERRDEMTCDEMTELITVGEATAVDLDDPASPVDYDGGRWRFDGSSEVFRRE